MSLCLALLLAVVAIDWWHGMRVQSNLADLTAFVADSIFAFPYQSRTPFV
jgi:hypothetical protein